jgi:hypothetical protein
LLTRLPPHIDTWLTSILCRLHDIRSPRQYEREFVDTIDSNPIYHIHPFGHDRFLVGAGADAIVKIFDLRMQNTYSYTDTNLSSSFSSKQNKRLHNSPSTSPEMKAQKNGIRVPKPVPPSRDFSFFISQHPPTFAARRTNYAYRGPIYSMSSPSPSSSTIYTGIVDGIVRLDFAATDDLTGSNSEWYHKNLALDLSTMMENQHNNNNRPAGRSHRGEDVLELSGYERPRPENMSASAKLRTQKPFWDVTEKDVQTERETGWDRRWRRLEEGGFWRRRRSR